MIVREPTQQVEQRTIRLSSYVDRPLGSLVQVLAGPRVDELLAASAARAGRAAELPRVEAHAEEAEWVSSTHARIRVHWSVADPVRPLAGSAVISLLVVQSGEHAVTELLVATPVGPDVALAAGSLLRHVMDELAVALEASVG